MSSALVRVCADVHVSYSYNIDPLCGSEEIEGLELS